ncbi:hypothetical protein BATDEDRAFT_15754 [Batrachochytrium dendrobatidis JAM81]|uniref:Multidrug resistance protein 1 n=2 Tax=Batrachochytrium dendrobatidis TaxID=109871 RepID=F4NUS4_BATDJ|nr:uncharacterized protein BATDEDRAFT_15754 [Batrachochytrium dendrobatidis JAM81]EGF83631.1 hypothetical protein BATDEDRAFT_15754 [Batrachochytrium dendrobatidis JAM81]KAJ8327392.1 hypothetical protein O5D80_004782 [Batrachochytrium dendrobatidis]KAK5665219.1 hypothetical protein QVD99_008064 [Batrachochytrium dendrobatidis]OAJ37495.1 hypothetical protein BDEG_21510 [Batrachochytrium dendrobatidis JEL423]|eukprot:XP_006675147.1 hypothetical protein BATDEDRAFT_15754 [Batrachochytrium dendrobatidis JAM81]
MTTKDSATVVVSEFSPNLVEEPPVVAKPEKSIFPWVNKKANPTGPKVAYLSLYRHATAFDKVLITIGVVCAMVNGAILPYMTIAFADIMDALIIYDGTPAGLSKLNSTVSDGVFQLAMIGLGAFVLSYIQMSFWMLSGENQSKRIRELYFKAILRQEVAWFDKTSTGELTSRMNADTTLIQEGMSDKIGLIIQSSAAFIAGFVIGFVKGWRLTLVLCVAVPIIAGCAMVLSGFISGKSTDQQEAYAESGDISQQALSSMRTVAAFGGEDREADRYAKHLDRAEAFGLRMALFNGLGIGITQMVIFDMYALAFYYGNTLIPTFMGPGEVVNVFFAIIIGAFSLGSIGTHLFAMGSAQGAAYKIFETIDRMSPIDSSSDAGLKPESVKGTIQFTNIKFHYPSREDVPIFKDFTLTVPEGKTVALVGSSGSGKSTTVKLIERFYDPVSGNVFLDGTNLKDLNVAWLRQQIGIVSQEPTLFDCSLRQNIMYGYCGDASSLSAEKIDQMVEEACKMANAWEFIQKLPKGIDTDVGEAGSMLSGGQKQRIAIARAIIKNPRILLLDEATSALDTESERVVQVALEKASKNRTTVVIAHRLSTIRTADVIVVMAQGEIVETGTHDSLVALGGVYHGLVQAQTLHTRDGGDMTEEAVDEARDSVDIPKAKAAENPLSRLDSRHSRKSVASDKVDASDEESEKNEKVEIFRILQLNRPEWWLFAIGGVGAAINGVIMPLFSVVFSSILVSLGTPRANFWALMFVVLSLVALLASFCQIGLFKYAGQKLTRRLRDILFRAMLRQEIAFFDRDENSTGILTTKLAEDSNLVQGVTGPVFGATIQAIAGIIAGVAIAFSGAWQLALVTLVLVPLIGLSGYLQIQALVGYGKKSRKAYEDAGQTATEAIGSIRTVVMLTQEKTFYDRFLEQIKVPHRMSVQGAFVAAFGFAFSQAIMLWAWSLSFYYGSRLIVWGMYDSQTVFRVIFATIFTAMSAGQITQHTPDAAKAKLAAISIFKLLDRESKINHSDPSGESRTVVEGQAAAREIKFAYPTRPKDKVLTGLSMDVLPGTTVAFVGRSGCGKSTVLGLLERWYDAGSGSASLDGLDVRDWNLKNLRSHMALVGQEPSLFNMSIKDNIGYGATKEYTDSDVISAAKLANIHDFISQLPKGYDTFVGEKGGLLSGGQKQRIAIARALIRNPRLLLLDEATSALDSESEKVVQAALDAAAKGRTTLVIAHRLSTIQGADKIMVVNGGKIVESGTHFELVDKRGEYFDLVSQQVLAVTKPKA